MFADSFTDSADPRLRWCWRSRRLHCSGRSGELNLKTGKEIFRAGCAGCHGPDGKGAPDTRSVSRSRRRFRISPIARDHARAGRGLARDDPRGRPRPRVLAHHALVYRGADRGTDRPGHRVSARVLQGAGMAARRVEPAAPAEHREGVSRRRDGGHDRRSMPPARRGSTTRSSYEKRFGARNNIEVVVPFSLSKETGRWLGGVGDIAPRREARACFEPAHRVDLLASRGRSSCRPAIASAASGPA